MIYLDTHILVWLYLGDPKKISNNAKNAINRNNLVISPIVCLELEYLYEIGRLQTMPDVMLNYLKQTIGLELCTLPFKSIINYAIKQTWTRDPFDRIIVGNADVQECGLVTKDESILKPTKK